MKHAPSVARLIDALRTLPGVGPKTAQRMAFHLLQDGRDGARRLAEGIDHALTNVGRCRYCRMFTEAELCAVCESPQRDASLLCVVESPADVVAIEQSGGYRGRYFVLMGHLSPLDGIGPEQLGVGELEALLNGGLVQEVILATNPRSMARRPHTSSRNSPAPAACARRGSRTASRSAANSSTSMVARSRTR